MFSGEPSSPVTDLFTCLLSTVHTQAWLWSELTKIWSWLVAWQKYPDLAVSHITKKMFTGAFRLGKTQLQRLPRGFESIGQTVYGANNTHQMFLSGLKCFLTKWLPWKLGSAYIVVESGNYMQNNWATSQQKVSSGVSDQARQTGLRSHRR